MWSFGRFALKLSDAEFWRLNLRKYSALQRRHHEELVRAERLNAILAATFVNHSMSPPNKPVEIWRFMPSNWGKEEEIEARQAEADIRKVFSRMVNK